MIPIEDNLYFEKDKEIDISQGVRLPHWNQSDKLQFVTIHLGDSLPKKVRDRIIDTQERFKKMNPEPWNEETLKKYRNLTSDHTDKLLDNGYGSCVFRHSDIRKILSESLWYYHGKSYYIDSYVIMPNHLHILVRMIGNTKVHEVFSNIKNYTARLINARLQLSGRFWQRENFDRIVRSEDAYKHYRNYIINNPRNLPNSQYELYY